MSNADTPALPAAPAALPPGMALGIAAMVAAALAMSISPSLVRLADVGPFASAFWRVALALPLLWAWMRGEETRAPTRTASGGLGRDRFTLPTILSGVVFAGDLFFWHLSVMKTTIANATFFATCSPIWVVLFGWLLLGERVARPVLKGLGLCLVGGAALVAQSIAFNPDHAVGDGLGIVTGVFFGLYFLAVGAARLRTGAARVTFELSVVAALLLFVAALVMEPRLLPQSGYGWAVLLVLALVSHAGGQGLLSVALGRLPAAFSSLVLFLEAMAAAVVAWAVLGEAVSPLQMLGGIVILAGLWIARPRPVPAVAL